MSVSESADVARVQRPVTVWWLAIPAAWALAAACASPPSSAATAPAAEDVSAVSSVQSIDNEEDSPDAGPARTPVDAQADDLAVPADATAASAAAPDADTAGPGDGTAALLDAANESDAGDAGAAAAGQAEDASAATDLGNPDSVADAETAAAGAVPDTADLAEPADADAATDPAADVASPDTDSNFNLPKDPTVYTPVAEFGDPSWTPPEGIQSSPPINCDPEGPGMPGKFIDVADPAGVDLLRPDVWPASSPFAGFDVREGGGQALADFNSDGRLDLYFAVATGDDALFLGQPGSAWSFKGFPISSAGVEEHSAVAADLDNDGDPDLVVGGSGVRIYRNDGPSPYTGVVFTDVTALSGLDKTEGQALFGCSVADLNRDGWLDLVVAGHRFEHPVADGTAGVIAPSLLLRGKGAMIFENQSSLLPIAKPGVTFAVSLVDVDSDGDQDLYFANDFGGMFGPNQLVRNDLVSPGQPIQLSNVSALSGADVAGNTMGVAIGDLNHDGWIDLFFSGWNTENTLLLNSTQPGKKPTFDNATVAAGKFLTSPGFATWGVQLVDVDADGWLDALMPNGHLAPGGGGEGPGATPPGGSKPPGGGSGSGGPGVGFADNPLMQPDKLYKGQANGTFVDVSAQSGFADPDPGRALSVGDIDRDGFPDLVLGTVLGKSHLYRNGCSADQSWLHVRLNGTQSNRSGIGARITVIADGVSHLRDIEAGSTSVWCSSEPAALFGLGTATQASLLMVSWPSGKTQVFNNIPLRRRLLITEP